MYEGHRAAPRRLVAFAGNYWCCYGPISVRDIEGDQYSNLQHEKTRAFYGMGYFGWEDLKIPVDGNLGVRVVRTDMSTSGFVVHPSTITDINGNQGFYHDLEASGGATDNVLGVWKSAAPAIDMISPDIYFRDHRTVTRVMDLYRRNDNALYVSEIGNDQPFARYLFSAPGRQAIGFTPFGMDYSDYSNYPLGAEVLDDDTLAPFANVFALVAPMAREWARRSFEGRTWGVAEPRDAGPLPDDVATGDEAGGPERYLQRLDLGRWTAEVSYGRPMFGNPPPVGNHPAAGGVLIAELGSNEYLVTGLHARVTFSPSQELEGEHMIIARVEEGHFDSGHWTFERVWNGDQVDWGLNFSGNAHLLKVKLATWQGR